MYSTATLCYTVYYSHSTSIIQEKQVTWADDVTYLTTHVTCQPRRIDRGLLMTHNDSEQLIGSAATDARLQHGSEFK